MHGGTSPICLEYGIAKPSPLLTLWCMKTTILVVQNDTQLVSILFRTHKSLPVAGKISSLYAFDALARAARNQVNKQGLTGDLNSTTGNCATFLLKVEGVLDSLYQDLVSSGNSELKVSLRSSITDYSRSHLGVGFAVVCSRLCMSGSMSLSMSQYLGMGGRVWLLAIPQSNK